MEETVLKGHQALLNPGEENEQDIFGYKTNSCRRAMCNVGAVLTCGFLLLVFYWKPEWDVRAQCSRCSLQDADVLLIRPTGECKVWVKKKVMWIQLSSQCNPSRLPCPLIADQISFLNKIIMEPDLKVRYVQVQKIRYIWKINEKQFVRVGGLEDSHSCSDIRSKFGSGLTAAEANTRRLIFGPNTIDIQIIPLWKLLCKEVLNPFYVFQVFSVCLWISNDYIEYSVAIIIMSLISIAFSVYEVRQQSVKLHGLVESHNHMTVTVCRKDVGYQEVLSSQLVPGDLFLVTGNKRVLPCDAVLIQGGCIVNESMLTGESVPVTKTPLPSVAGPTSWWSSSADHKLHLLFCGTQVIQTKTGSQGEVKAVVHRTGFSTAKGELVRSILYPKPMDFKLYQDAFRFLMCLGVIAILGMIYTICVFLVKGRSVVEMVKKALDVITIAVSPALPASITVGIIYSTRRLKKKGIFCISPQRINVCGQLNLVCFDKTGTLTEEGLDLWGLATVKGKGLQSIFRFSGRDILPWGPFFGALASCHSLSLSDNNLQGDPLDLKMFEATCWEIDENQQDGGSNFFIVKPGPKANKESVQGIIVLNQFPFSSALQRMSVVTQLVGRDKFTVYLKGAPETVAALCIPTTVPRTFSTELQRYTTQGFRVIGFAYKSLWNGRVVPVTSLKREEVESDLVFLGFLILENKLKSQTIPVLEELLRARIRTVMITGDNLQTAVTVARKSGMIPAGQKLMLIDSSDGNECAHASISWKLMESGKDNGQETKIQMDNFEKKRNFHFALSGKSFDVLLQHFYHLLPKILVNATVFARMSPSQKGSLIQEFQKLDYCVGMCGDGANDCGALKNAHAGISLSKYEASVSSPFTSNIDNIECVTVLIKEGRAALVTSFCMFKFMAIYSMIQYLAVLLLYWKLNTFGGYQFLFQDLAIITIVGMTMNLNHAYPMMVPYRPPSQLISPPLLLSVLLNIALNLALNIVGFVMVTNQPWYSHTDMHSACRPENNLTTTSVHNVTAVNQPSFHSFASSHFQSYENTTVWFLSTLSLVTTAFVMCKGKPFRQPIYTNYLFILVLLAQSGICLFLLFVDHGGVYKVMDLVCTPYKWRVYVLIMVAVHFVIVNLVEEMLIETTASGCPCGGPVG
eukprot:gi/632968599/ref/XP_007900615.1/ PREDICTED: probable cation-transporting ATPase 13A4 [Callorhinchus milii]